MRSPTGLTQNNFPDRRDSTRAALSLIALFLALRIAVSWFFPATIDESYAIAVSRAWSLSYYDHPPIAFTIARLMAWLTGSESVFVIRIPFILAGAASAWLLYDITRLAYGARAAWWALAWFSVAPFFFISAGHFVVPDGPLDLFLLATLRLVLPDLLAQPGPPRVTRWLFAGGCFALALSSKYQAVLFGVAAVGFLLTSGPHRKLLLSPAVWVAFGVAGLGLVPVVAWNAAHGWISFGFQSGRAATGGFSLHPANFAVTVIGQMAYLLPGTWIVILLTTVRGVWRPKVPADRLFGWFVAVPVSIFLAIALVSRFSLPHWAMPGFLFGFPLAGRWTAAIFDRHRRPVLLSWRISAAAIPALALAVALQAQFAPFTRLFFDAAPRFDIDWQMQDWTALRDAWRELGRADAVVVGNWTEGSKAGHALGPDVTVVPMRDPRHFRYLMEKAGSPNRMIAVQAIKPGQTAPVMEAFMRLLAASGYRTIGDPQTLPQKTGYFLRFDIVAIPVEKN